MTSYVYVTSFVWMSSENTRSFIVSITSFVQMYENLILFIILMPLFVLVASVVIFFYQTNAATTSLALDVYMYTQPCVFLKLGKGVP